MKSAEQTVAPHAPAVPDTPFCGLLRSKRLLMLDVIPTDAAQFMDPSGHCWCYTTQKGLGPDGQYADPEDCVPGRVCYRSALAPDGPDEAGGPDDTRTPASSTDANDA